MKPLTPAGRRTLARAASRGGAVYPSSLHGAAQEMVHKRLLEDGHIVFDYKRHLWVISDLGREALSATVEWKA